jgi:hypothetical protein
MRTEQTVRGGWEELAAAAAGVEGDGPAVAALAGVVLALERAADASLGPVDGEGRVALQRRFSRAQRLGAATIGPALVQQHLATLRSPAPGPTASHSTGAVTVLNGTSAAAGWCPA